MSRHTWPCPCLIGSSGTSMVRGPACNATKVRILSVPFMNWKVLGQAYYAILKWPVLNAIAIIQISQGDYSCVHYFWQQIVKMVMTFERYVLMNTLWHKIYYIYDRISLMGYDWSMFFREWCTMFEHSCIHTLIKQRRVHNK